MIGWAQEAFTHHLVIVVYAMLVVYVSVHTTIGYVNDRTASFSNQKYKASAFQKCLFLVM